MLELSSNFGRLEQVLVKEVEIHGAALNCYTHRCLRFQAHRAAIQDGVESTMLLFSSCQSGNTLIC